MVCTRNDRKSHIRSKILTGNTLRAYQHAYRGGHLIETTLYQLTDALWDTIETKQIAQCALLDIKGAFHNKSHIEVQDTLISKGVGNTLAFRVGRMLESRQIEIPTGTNHKHYSRLSTQGGVL